MMVNDEPKLVVVEILDPALKAHYGARMTIGVHNARVGEQRGKWRIIEEGKTDQSKIYETQVMEAKRPNTLTHCDMHGEPFSSKVVKKKQIAWLQDHSRTGGAELTNFETTRVGRECGFQILLGTPNNTLLELEATLASADVIVLNNLFEFLPPAMRLILEVVFSKRKSFVKFEHDHRELGRADFSRRLFQNSSLNVFLSPVHLENHQRKLGCEGICLPLAIDPKPFLVGRNDHRKLGTALVCNTRHFKTWATLQRYVNENPEVQFTLLADSPVVSGPNVHTRPMVSFDQMPEVYSEYEFVVHLLDGWGAGERVIFEAALSGCKIVSNERAGHTSWERDLTDREGLAAWLTQAPFDFWKAIDKVGG